MGTCLAPCVNKIDESIYNEIREEIKSFMRGNNQKQIAELKKKMLSASEKQEYEMANEYKKTISAIEHLNVNQNVEMADKTDRDIFAFAIRDGYLSLAVFLYRKGILLGKQVFVVEEFGDPEEEVADLILQFYQKQPTPNEVIINNDTIVELLNDLLDCSVNSVSKGKLLELVISAKENANNALDEYFLSAKLDDSKLELLEELGRIINIPTPLHIELFDNSHIQGSSPVGAMVAFINGEPAKKLYRKFKIEHEEARDDLKSMEEITYRHYSRLVNEKQKLPDLILVDGGQKQIKVTIKALENAKANIPVFGLVKNDKHQTRGLMDANREVYPIENKSIFFLLTRMQDEVHRFAITFHKEKRNKAMKSSLLDNVEGLGDKGKEKIYRAYQDINLLKEASLEELEQILPKKVALNLYNKIHFGI